MEDQAPPPIDSRQAWTSALHWGLKTATGQGARQMTWVDADFTEWPLNDAGWLQQLTAWLRLPQRRLVLLAADFSAIPQQHPRFMAWRRDWSHAVEARQVPPELATGLPLVLLDDRQLSVQLLDPVHWRGRAAQDARVAHLIREQVDAVLQRSEIGFPVNTLGL
jgi:hypothetical protein